MSKKGTQQRVLWAGLAVTLITSILGSALSYAKHDAVTPIDCGTQVGRYLKLETQYPNANLHVPVNSPLELQCGLNEDLDSNKPGSRP